MTPKAIFFDHDDTLVATFEAKQLHHKYIAKTFYGKELTDEEVRLHWGKPLKTLMQILYETPDAETAMAHNIATRDLFPKRCFEGTVETLAALRAQGLKIGLVTATARFSLQHDFLTLHIPETLFDYVQTEEDTKFHKPDPLVFAPTIGWLAEQHIAPCETIYVGDTLNDMRAALGAGFQFIGVGTGLVSPEEFEKENVRAVAKLSDLSLHFI